MLGRLNELENEVLDSLEKYDSLELKELKSILANLNYAVDSARIGICQWNIDRTISRTNSQFLKNFGYSEHHKSQPFLMELQESFFPEDVNRAKALELQLYKGEIDSFELDIRQTVEGRFKWWRYVVTINRNTHPEPLFTALCWDITSEKELIDRLIRRENQLIELNSRLNGTIQELELAQRSSLHAQSLLDVALHESNAYIWEWNIQERWISIDLPVLSDDSVGQTVYTIDKVLEKIYPDDITKIQMDRIMDNNNNVTQKTFTIDLRINSENKGYKWFEFRGCVVERDYKGQPVHLKGVAIDIQDRKEKEEQMMAVNEKAVESEKQKYAFLSNITNELRTPLQAIVAFSELLVTMESREERMNYLAAIKQNNDILLGMIGNVLDHSDMENVEEPLCETPVSLWEYMVEMQQIYSLKIQGPVRLIFTNSYDNMKVLIDKEKLNQILDHLLSNAIKFTKAGYISYGYEVKLDKLVITINDTGVGMQEDKLREIFNTVDKRDAIPGALNHGLSICRSLVRKMKGEIRGISQIGAGSSFIIELPLNLDVAAMGAPAPKLNDVVIMPQEEVIVEKRNLPTILIAEDIVYSYMMMKTLLEDHFNVIHAENGERAVELFLSEQPDFIFMDIKMPVMDGLEATRRIRQHSSTVPVIVLTAYAVRSLKKEAADAGCTDILTKPTTAKQINAVIRKHMKK